MSRKPAKSRREDSGQLFERAQRELAKGNAKDALRDAKVCFRSDPKTEHRSLLERAYVGRAEQLHRMKLGAEARNVLAELLEMGATEPEVVQRLPYLRVIVGDPTADAKAVLEQSPELLAELADRAVLDPASVVPDVAQIRTHAADVRRSLEAVARGEDAVAVEALNGIPRNSPLSDWRFLVRGLVAFHAGDAERTQLNWQRLAPSRPAFRIAETLRVASGDKRPDEVAPPIAERASGLLRRLDDPALASVERLAKFWTKGSWRYFIRELARLRQLNSAKAPQLVETITEMAWKRAARDKLAAMLDDLKRTVPAPRLDPQWNRATALLGESERRLEVVEPAWNRYAEELLQLESLPESDRPVAAALVHLRLAICLLSYADDIAGQSAFYDREWVADAQLARNRATTNLKRSIALCPRLKKAYLELAGLYESKEQPEQAEPIYQQLLQQFPEDFDTHLWLANFYLDKEETEKSALHVRTVTRLKPRDASCRCLSWNQQITTVRQLTKAKKLDLARQHCDELQRCVPPGTAPYVIDIVRAAIEFKAKNQELARQYLNTALSSVEEPTAVWLQMSVTATRYGLPRPIKKEYEDLFLAGLEKPPTSQTAGLLARFCLQVRHTQMNYVGRMKHERLVVGFLNRAHRLPWTPPDLRASCQLLLEARRERKHVLKLLQLGVERFPNDPWLLLWDVAESVNFNSYRMDFERVARRLKRVLELAQGEPDFGQHEIDRAKRLLSHVERCRSDEFSFFGFGPMGGLDDDEDEFEDEEDIFGDDGWDEGDGDFGLGSGGPGGPSEILAMLETMPPELKQQCMMAILQGKGPEEILHTIKRFIQSELDRK